MKKLALTLNPILAALVLGACSTAPTMSDKASWRVEPTQSVRHGGAVRAEGYFALGRAREGQGMYPKAADAYRKALAADPSFVPAWNALGVLQVQVGQFDEGIRAIERAISLAPSASYLYNNLGYALMLAERNDTAAVALRRAVELDANNRRAWRNLAALWRELGNPEQAAFADARADGATPPAPPKPDYTSTNSTAAPASAASGITTVHSVATERPVGPVAISLPVPPPAAGAASMQPLSPANNAARTGGAFAAESAPTTPAPAISMAPDMSLVKVAENVYELRNAPQTRAAVISEAAAIITATAPPSAGAPNPVATVETAPKPAARTATVRPARYEITNGQGAEGLARRLATMLGRDGFARPRLTNHRPFDQAVSYVEYREGYRDAASAFVDRLPFRPVLRPAAEGNLAVDVRLMLGKDLYTSDACDVLGLCRTLARKSAPSDTDRTDEAGIRPASIGAPKQKRPPSDQI